MKKLSLKAIFIGLFTISLFASATATANAATLTVTKSTNSNDGVCNADCSLREAVDVALSGDTIVFNSNLVGQTFTLGGSEIVIDKTLTINGDIDGVNVVFLSAEGASRHFNVTSGTFALTNMILVQGSGSEGGSIFAANGGNTRLDRVAIRGNNAIFVGAMSVGTGLHRITNSSFSGNSAPDGCSAVRGRAGGNLFMANVTLAGNDAASNFGAICIFGAAKIRNSTIVNNSAAQGAGITLFGTATLE
ncbi:MAG: hypothetical protein ABL952_16520, partial [Pyrinomonadaceae bacterium]